MTHITEEDLVLLYYNEADVPQGARRHLRECGECASAARKLAQDLAVCNEWGVPEPDADLARSVWAQIAPQLDESRPHRYFRWLRIAGVLAATATLLLVAFVAGRASRQRTPSITAGLSKQARERILAITLADHLDRAEMLLTEISDDSQMSDERARAQDLVEEGRLMRQTLARDGQTPTLAMLDEVERFMLEIANAPERTTPAEMRELRDRIGSGSLLFKVRIIESNLRNEGQKL